MNGVGLGNSGAARDQRPAAFGNAADDLSAMLGWAEKQNRSLPFGDIQARGRGLELLALRAFWRGVV